MLIKILRTLSVAAFALVSINTSAQDLLAKQAPIDRKLKSVDSLALVRQTVKKDILLLPMDCKLARL